MSKEVFATYLDDVARVQEFYGAFSSRLDNVPSDGGWSASQCLAHICDTEISLSLRVRMMLTSDNYQFLAWDEDAFAAIKKDRDAKTSVETFAALRRNNLDLLTGLTSDKLERLGVKANGEPIKLIDYLAYMSKHIKAHLEQAVAASK